MDQDVIFCIQNALIPGTRLRASVKSKNFPGFLTPIKRG